MFKWFAGKKKANDEEILEILRQLTHLLSGSEDSLYSGLGITELISLMEKESCKLQAGEKVDYGSLTALFAPTGPLQEISVDNGWADTFIELANRYDSATLFRG